MRARHLGVIVVLFVAGQASAQTQGVKPNPFPYNPNEATARFASVARGVDYLDRVAEFWMKDSCGQCHGNYSYLMARSMVTDIQSPLVEQSRQFMQDLKKRRAEPTQMFSEAAIVTSAAGLAFLDAGKGKLQPGTRAALDMMWTVQRPDGGWFKGGCGSFPPAENDRYYTAIMAALAAYVAPEDYARSAGAQDGLTKLRRFLEKNPPPDPHHQALRLWASLHMDGLMTAAERQAAINALLSQQRPDGGWSLVTLRPKPEHHVAPYDRANPPSDGYSTGFAVFVLRQAGVSANRSELVRGAAWLRHNQRVSGVWFTPSPHEGHVPEAGKGTRELIILNTGTAFAVMALKACGEPTVPGEQPIARLTGLSLRTRFTDDWTGK